MEIFWINIEVDFNDSMQVFDESDKNSNENAQGFFQEFGCTDINENSAKKQIFGYLNSFEWLDLSNSKVIFERIGVIPYHEIETEIYNDPDIKDSILSDPKQIGLWYISGKAFFTDQDCDDDFSNVEIKKT